jgi:hypothetical protein
VVDDDEVVYRRVPHPGATGRVTDHSAVNRAIEIWLNQGFGRTLEEELQRQQSPLYRGGLSLEEVERILGYLRDKDPIIHDYSPDELRQMVELWETHKQQRNGSKP